MVALGDPADEGDKRIENGGSPFLDDHEGRKYRGQGREMLLPGATHREGSCSCVVFERCGRGQSCFTGAS